jgi:hypothetical protein
MDRVRGDVSVGKSLTLDKARRIASNIAKLPELEKIEPRRLGAAPGLFEGVSIHPWT